MTTLKRAALSTTLAGAFIAGLWAARPFFRINTTDSMPKGLYAVLHGPQAPFRDHLAVVCLPQDWAAFALSRGYIGHGECEGDYSALLKPIAAVPGDIVTLTNEGVLINGKSIRSTSALLQDSRGRALMSFPAGDYRVEPGTVWLFSDHDPRSFDSRYFGAIATDRIVGAAYPLLTF